MSGITQYRIRSGDPEILWAELNRILGLISDRLDKIEGFRGTPRFYDSAEFSGDVICLSASDGLVLKDNGDPANYWRVTIDSSGTLQHTNLGRSYD